MFSNLQTSQVVVKFWEWKILKLVEMIQTFFSKTLISYSFPIHPTKRKIKKNKRLSTFKPFSLINSFAIQDTQGEIETDAVRNCKNAWTKTHALYRKSQQVESIQLHKETAKGQLD